MRSDNVQLDLLDHDPARLAEAARKAAEAALHQPRGHFTPQEAHDHYMAQAHRYDELAAMCIQRSSA